MSPAMIVVEKVGKCPPEWSETARIQRLVDFHKERPQLGTTPKSTWWFVGDPDDGPTHQVSLGPDGTATVKIYGPWWMNDDGSWAEWVDLIDSLEVMQ